jgi:hypothetical protein
MTLRLSLTSAMAVLAAFAVTASAQTPAPAPAATAQSPGVPPYTCVGPKYPSHESTTQLRGDAYNRAIEAFNRDYKTYAECVKKYVEDTKALVKEIAEAGNKAIDEYNKYAAQIKEQVEAEKK